LTVLLLSYAGMCNVPNFEVDAFTSGERYFPDLYDNTVVWWEGGNGGQLVWYDWLAEEEGVFPAASSQPLHSRIYKRFVVWSDEFSADPNIYLADLVPGDTNDVVSLWIDYPEDGDDITNGSVIVHGGTLSLASEITNVAWRLYTGDGEFLDNGVADGTEEWSFALELVPLDAGYDIYVSTTDELGYFNEEEISIFYDTTNELYTVAEIAAVSSQSVTVICDAPGAQINPDIYGQYVVWEDHRNTNSCIYLYDRLSEVTTLLTNVPSNQIQPAIYGNTIVWVDYRNGNADIYAYDIASSTVFPLCTNDFDQLKPDVFGNIVVWEDYRNGNANVFALNMSNGVEFVVNESKWPQLVPRVSDSWIVWEDWRSEQGESDIYGYDLSSCTTKMIYSEEMDQMSPAVFRNRIVWMDDQDEFWAIYAGFPVDNFIINDGESLTKTPWVELSLQTTYPRHNWMDIENDKSGGSSYYDEFQTSLVWRLPEVDGVRTVTVEFEYPDGNTSGEIIDTIILDQNPPRTEEVTVDPSPVTGLFATVTIEFVEVGSGLDYNAMPEVTIRPVTGTPETIAATSYANNKWVGVWSNAWAASGRAIIAVSGARDKVGYTMLPESFAAYVTVGDFFSNAWFTLNGGATLTSNAAVTVNIHTEGAAQMKLAQDPDDFEDIPWINFKTPMSWILEDEDDDNEVYLVLRDEWRNESLTMMTQIYYHASPTEPEDPQVRINGESSHTRIPSVMLLLYAEYASSMRINNSKQLSAAKWIPYATRHEWTLPQGKGNRTVYVQFRDIYGEESEVVSDSITLSPGKRFTVVNDFSDNVVHFRYRGNGILIVEEGTEDDDFDKVEIVNSGPDDRLVISAVKITETKDGDESEKMPVSITKFVTDGDIHLFRLLGSVGMIHLGTTNNPATAHNIVLKKGDLYGLFARTVKLLRIRAGNLTSNIFCSESLEKIVLQRKNRFANDGSIVDAVVQVGATGKSGNIRKWRVNGLYDSRVFVGLSLEDDPSITPSVGKFGLLRGREAINSVIAGADAEKKARVLFKSATDTVFYRTKDGKVTKEDVNFIVR